MTTPLQRLVRLAPPPAAPAPADWAGAERRLGHRLPTDFKQLIDTYGDGQFDEHIRVRGPEDSPAGRGLVSMNDGYFEDLEDVWEMNEEAPQEFADRAETDGRDGEEDGGRPTLIVWARTKDADTLNWVVRPGTAPDRWPIMVLDGDARVWERYDMTATAFLASLLAGESTSDILSPELTPPAHTFRPRGA